MANQIMTIQLLPGERIALLRQGPASELVQLTVRTSMGRQFEFTGEPEPDWINPAEEVNNRMPGRATDPPPGQGHGMVGAVAEWFVLLMEGLADHALGLWRRLRAWLKSTPRW